MATKIEVLDKIMGSGKSTAVLNWCESPPEWLPFNDKSKLKNACSLSATRVSEKNVPYMENGDVVDWIPY